MYGRLECREQCNRMNARAIESTLHRKHRPTKNHHVSYKVGFAEITNYFRAQTELRRGYILFPYLFEVALAAVMCHGLNSVTNHLKCGFQKQSPINRRHWLPVTNKL